MQSNSQGNCLRLHALAILMLFAVVMVAGLLVPAQAQTFPVVFPTPTTFGTSSSLGQSIITIGTGDFNGDGKLDVVAIDSGSDLNVILGKGDGTFQAPIVLNIATGNIFYQAIAVGDFNGDKLQDVAIWTLDENTGSMEVRVYLGNGAGSFTMGGVFNAPNSSTFAAGPNSIVAADVNGDNKLDLVAATLENGVFVYFGNGDGTFQTPTNYSYGRTSGCCDGVAVGDLNGDGKLDLALPVNDGVSVLLNNGTGTFGTAVYYDSAIGGSAPGDGIAIGDLNGDKKNDIVITDENLGAIVFLNQGSGTFAVDGTVGNLPVSSTNNVLLADINGDKKLDIVMPDIAGDVFTFLGKGTGLFSNGASYPLQVASNSSPYIVVLGDFNGDGTLDLLDTDGLNNSTLSLGRGDGTFRTAQMYSFTTVFFTGNNVVSADFNGDGIPDAAYSSVPLQTGSDRQSFAVLLSNSHGALGAPSYVAAGSCSANQTNFIATGDVNGDGKADMVATLVGSTTAGCQLNTVAVLGGLGTGKFGKPAYYSTGAASTAQEQEIYLVDLNGDGHLDIVTGNTDGTISVLLNKGKGTYSPGTLITSLAALTAADNPIVFADFNGDNKMDIGVVLNHTISNASSVYVLLGNGNGTFGAPMQTIFPVFPVNLVAGDFNKDGKMDVVVSTTSFSGCPDSGYTFGQGNGNGTFTPGTTVCVPYLGSGKPVAADLNSDGNLDVVIPYAGGTDTAVGPAIMQGNGDGTFKTSALYYGGQAAFTVAIADFNGDGMPDVLLLNDGGFSSSFLTEMLNASQPVSVSPLTTNFGSVTVATKKSATVILTNNQTKSLAITSITVGGTNASDFTETNNCGVNRKPGWDCTITVTFDPTATGARTGTLSIVDAVGTQTVQLNGTGK